MELSEMISQQQAFDAERMTTFRWSLPISESDTRALLHNVLGLAGEVGELADLVKKLDRGDYEFSHIIGEIPGELADILIYLFKLSYQSGIDLEKAFCEKLEQNRRRFPVFGLPDQTSSEDGVEFAAHELAITLDESAIRSGVDRAEAALRSALLPADAQNTLDLFRTVGLQAPRDPWDGIRVVLASLVYAQAYGFEAQPGRRDDLWRAVAPLVEPLGFSRSALASLTTKEGQIVSALGIRQVP